MAGLNIQSTGVYSINKDGSGDVQFNFSNGTSALYRITLSDSSHFYMEEDDGFNTSGGSGEKQDPTAFTSVPSGTFVLQTHDLVAGSSKVGVTTWTGRYDLWYGRRTPRRGTFFRYDLRDAQAPATATGRGTVTITDDTGTSHYAYYVVNSTKTPFPQHRCTIVARRSARLKRRPVVPSRLRRSTVPMSSGAQGKRLNLDGIHSVGLFAADGGGNVTDGSFDFVQDGSPVTGITLNSGSTYTWMPLPGGR